MLKHEAFEAEVTANKGRVFGIVEMGQGERTMAAPPHPRIADPNHPHPPHPYTS